MDIMEIFGRIDWVTVSITAAVLFVVYNLFVIAKYMWVKYRAEKEIMKINEKIENANKILEEAKQKLMGKLESERKNIAKQAEK
ncbi:hypothetical protein A2625_07670 [candidate division WOR-1 bacterium RIFCSPHIGHO2_01_FULL_53_15]|uniref:Uncharacterized protein n=1 Tax=candidate division WOR-1 bacterium RIFCSPHIGHO2_01_FULL_53_15 TaxID=1802564 RepID=A0A1F4Q4M5_UNCSA|nr:MAG: hypothetical protein A2625_07670 [candidate division WOR-1 bacterium RIFCSPHIGHO2_01_FULL_53_15]OGC10548.1 MAG: hypothetical protein A3D23_01495 [candidate division WOR-1 bacterium RIFCSPHIGHO2_02_FULL_53_26]